MSATRPISVQTSQNDTSPPQSPLTVASEHNRQAPHPCAKPLFRPSLIGSPGLHCGLRPSCADTKRLVLCLCFDICPLERFETVLAAGQSAAFSIPRAADETPERVVLTSAGVHLQIAEPPPPFPPGASAWGAEEAGDGKYPLGAIRGNGLRHFCRNRPRALCPHRTGRMTAGVALMRAARGLIDQIGTPRRSAPTA